MNSSSTLITQPGRKPISMKFSTCLLPQTFFACAAACLTHAVASAQETVLPPSPYMGIQQVVGEAHQNLERMEDYLKYRLLSINLADEERIYDPFGNIKDAEIEPPPVRVEMPDDPSTQLTPETPKNVDDIEEKADALIITGFNARGKSILVGAREIYAGDSIPGAKHIILETVLSDQLIFRNINTGKKYVRPIGFSPDGISSRKQFVDGIQGVDRR